MDTSDLEGPRAVSKTISFGPPTTLESERFEALASRIGGHLQNDSLSKLRAVVRFFPLSVLICFDNFPLVSNCFTEGQGTPKLCCSHLTIESLKFETHLDVIPATFGQPVKKEPKNALKHRHDLSREQLVTWKCCGKRMETLCPPVAGLALWETCGGTSPATPFCD